MKGFEWLNDNRVEGYRPVGKPRDEDVKLTGDLLEDLVELRTAGQNTQDLVIREFTTCGIKAALVLCEGMFDLTALGQLVMQPLTALDLPDPTPQALLECVRHDILLAIDQSEVYTVGEVYRFIVSGFGVLLIDGATSGVAMAMQGFAYRSIGEPTEEVNLRGSREGFTEPLRINMSMIRRRIKSPALRFEQMTVGSKSKTDIFLVYMNDVVSVDLLNDIKRRLSSINIEMVLDTGYLQPFLERRPLSVFSGIGTTERPDTACAKISEGRVVVLMDGTPVALVVPYLFNEHFQSFDDYAMSPYYATFIRIIKYFSFFLTILLPGLYVAIGSFHPELLPRELLYNVAASVQKTPFSMMTEALIIHGMYEIMREAGLRMPRPVGHAVSIAGGLVIGDVAVQAGLIATPMIMVVALTAISSFVVPSLYEQVTILRFSFILIGGGLGLFGISVGLVVVMCNLCAVSSGGAPVTSPASPARLYSMRDIIIRWSWKGLSKRTMAIQSVPGSQQNHEADDSLSNNPKSKGGNTNAGRPGDKAD